MTMPTQVVLTRTEWERQVDDLVESFEQAQLATGQADVRDFLPDAQVPDYERTVVELLCVDLQYSWRHGKPKSLTDYLEQFSETLASPLHLAVLAYEDYRMRRLAGLEVTCDRYRESYGIEIDEWPDDTRRAPREEVQPIAERETLRLETARLAAAVELFPQVGQQFLDFELVEELGRGAFGLVYLARQAQLGQRPVVLKITAGASLEPQRLARLQHSHIVPIHSVHHQDALQAVCMPFFGRATLAHATRQLHRASRLPMQGSELLELLPTAVPEATNAGRATDDRASHQDVPPGQLGWPRAALARASYVEACLMIALQLAEGLRYAHQRGVVHRDLKPANVLIADDGTVMLLDFNLSDDIVAGGRASLMVGGTLPYLAPEHLRALLTGESVGPSGDVFALGVLLYELLTGRLPFKLVCGPFTESVHQMIAQRWQRPVNVRQFNQSVPRSVAALVDRLLHPDPRQRYASMGDVVDDLRRQLDHRPLRHVPDRSIPERLNKWSRRHPRLTSSLSVAFVSLLLLCGLTSVVWLRGRQLQRQETQAAIRDLKDKLPMVRVALSMPDVDEAVFREGLQQAEAALAQYLAGDPRRIDSLAASAQDDQPSQQLRSLLSEYYYLLAGARLHQTRSMVDRDSQRSCLADALQQNRQACELYGPREVPLGLMHQQAEILDGLGQAAPDRRSGEAEDRVPDRPASEDRPGQLVPALEDLRRGRYAKAVPQLEAACQAEPYDLSLWLLLGNALAGCGRLSEAEGCYNVCVHQWSDSYLGCWYRGLCRMEMRRYGEAQADFERVLQHRPDFLPALINRGIAQRELGHWAEAEADLTSALEQGATQTRLYLLRAQLRKRLADPAGAAQDWQLGLTLEPIDELSWIERGLARLADDPALALADFHQAARINPASRAAWRNIAHVQAERMQQPEQAIEVLTRLIERSGSHAEDVVARGVLYARQGQRAAALADAAETLRRGRSAKLLYQVGCIYALICGDDESLRARAVVSVEAALLADTRWLRAARSDPDLKRAAR